MRWLLDFCYLLAVVGLMPLLLYRSLATGKYRSGWRERLGHPPEIARVTGYPCVWIHAVSVGEVNAVRGLVTAWRDRHPSTCLVISTTTDTGQARARELFPDLTVFRYPLDFSSCVRRALDRVDPALIVLAELEVWYQFIAEATARKIPVVVVNGRLSERSVQRFSWIRPVARRMFERLAWVGAQDGAYAERFQRMGVSPDRISITGSLKWDTAQVADHIAGSEDLARAMELDAALPLWVCGSTGPGEETLLLAAYRQLLKAHPRLQLAIIPRKPERFDEVAALIESAGFEYLRRSRRPDGIGHSPQQQRTNAASDKPDRPRVILGDTMGELRKFYSLASVVFVGRTLAPMGGSDVMEVAGLARPIIVGPSTFNFADAVAQLESREAIRIVQTSLDDPHAAEGLAQAVTALLDSPASARALAENARQAVLHNRGATERTLTKLTELLERQHAQH
jgi:3-deoxy-D-manno-octulosonic-acid transferase